MQPEPCAPSSNRRSVSVPPNGASVRRVGAQPMPVAEVDVPQGLVRDLLTDQAPDLAHLPLRPLANGWDNVMWALGDHLAVRLPRRALAAGLVLHEQRWLPRLAPRLPLAVPAPVRCGVPGRGYPWPWSVVPLLPGDVAWRTPLTDPAAAARALADFLTALHVPAPPGAPVNAFRGGALADREPALLDRLALLGEAVPRPRIEETWRRLREADAWAGPPLWLHGDLHPGNILVSDGRISGVIDFGDITAGDPATDLSVAWMLLAPAHRVVFREVYAGTAALGSEDATWARARGWALTLSLAFLAHSADNPVLAALGRRTLGAVLE